MRVDERFTMRGVTYAVGEHEDLVFDAGLTVDEAELVFLRQLYCDYQGETLQGLRLHVQLPPGSQLADDELWLDGGHPDRVRTWIGEVSSRPAFALLESARGFEVGWAEIG